MNWTKEDAKVKDRLFLITASVGTQADLCKKIGMSEATLQRRNKDPGDLKLSELRKLAEIAHAKGIEFNPMPNFGGAK